MTRRALHVHPGNLFGGIETVLLTIARHALSDLRHDFAICFPGRLVDELGAARARVARLPPARLSRPWTVRRARLDLMALLQADPPDVVICHSPWSLVVFGPAIRRARLPLVLWLHGPLSAMSWLDRLATRQSPDLLICNSHFTAASSLAAFPNLALVPAGTAASVTAARSVTRAAGARPAINRAQVFYYPAEVRQPPRSVAPREELRRALGVGLDTTVILQVSRLEPWKGHRILLEALGRLGGSRGWTCWIAGGAQRRPEARYLQELQRTSERLCIADRVLFLGDRRDVANLLAAADIFCQPNAGPEPFGLVFVEALTAGLPVVSSDMGGAREIVTPQCGVLVPPGDAGALARALDALIQEPDQRRELGSQGPPRARQLCDPTTQLRRLAEVLAPLPAGRIEFTGPTA